MGLAVPGSAQAGANVGRDVEASAKQQTEAKLANNPEYQKATAERKKQIYAETIRETTKLEMQKVMTDMQRKIDRKVDDVLDKAMPKALGPDDPRIPQIRKEFKKELYVHINNREETSALYGMYEAAEGKGI